MGNGVFLHDFQDGESSTSRIPIVIVIVIVIVMVVMVIVMVMVMGWTCVRQKGRWEIIVVLVTFEGFFT
jgi:hypothetical protein